MTEEIFFIFVKVVEPPSLLSSVFGALSMFGIVVEVDVLVKVKELYDDDTSQRVRSSDTYFIDYTNITKEKYCNLVDIC